MSVSISGFRTGVKRVGCLFLGDARQFFGSVKAGPKNKNNRAPRTFRCSENEKFVLVHDNNPDSRIIVHTVNTHTLDDKTSIYYSHTLRRSVNVSAGTRRNPSEFTISVRRYIGTMKIQYYF